RDEQQRAERAQEPGDPCGAVPVPAARLDRDEPGRERGRDHRENAYRPESVGVEDAERDGIQVRDERWLAVDGVVIETAAVVEDLRLRREVRVVGIEDVDDVP